MFGSALFVPLFICCWLIHGESPAVWRKGVPCAHLERQLWVWEQTLDHETFAKGENQSLARVLVNVRLPCRALNSLDQNKQSSKQTSRKSIQKKFRGQYPLKVFVKKIMTICFFTSLSWDFWFSPTFFVLLVMTCCSTNQQFLNGIPHKSF